MEHAPDLGVLQHDGKAVPVGLPVVDDDRQVQLLRQGQLAAEHLLLKLPGGIFRPVVVQADLADGHHLIVPAQLPNGVKVPVGAAGAVLRVDTHGGVHVGIPLRQRHGGTAALYIAARVHHQSHPGGGEGGKHRVPVGVEAAGVIVGMGIENGHGNTSLLLWYGYSNTVLENKKGQIVNFPRARQKEKGHPLGCPFNQHDQPIWFSFRVMALLR